MKLQPIHDWTTQGYLDNVCLKKHGRYLQPGEIMECRGEKFTQDKNSMWWRVL